MRSFNSVAALSTVVAQVVPELVLVAGNVLYVSTGMNPGDWVITSDVPVTLTDAVVFKGVIDASANPNYPAADAGNVYRISVAGKIGGASGTNVEVGDMLICLTDSTLAGTQAAVGSAWSIEQANLDGALTDDDVGTTANKLVALDGDAKLPAVDGSALTNLPDPAADYLSLAGLPDFLNLALNGAINAFAVQADGKFIIAGDFTSVLGSMRNRIARINTDGSLDTWDPNCDGEIYAVAVQGDGKVVVGGLFFSTIGGEARASIARLDGTTGLADAWDPTLVGTYIDVLVVQGDGKVLVGGDFTGIGGQSRAKIARLDGTTGLADSFNPGANGIVWSIAVQADDKVLAGGSFTTIGGQTRHRIARLNATTGVADSFNPDASNTIRSVVVQADGKILVGGVFTTVGGQTRNHIARLDATTGLADSFDPNIDGDVYAIAVQTNGKILATGAFYVAGEEDRLSVVRISTAGVVDSFSLNLGGDAAGNAIAVQADGKILVGGTFTSVAPTSILAPLFNLVKAKFVRAIP